MSALRQDCGEDGGVSRSRRLKDAVGQEAAGQEEHREREVLQTEG